MKICSASLITAVLLPTFAIAEADPASGFDFQYGAGLVGVSGVYVGQKDDLLAFPVIAVSHGKWSFSVANGIQFTAVETLSKRLSFAIVYDPAPEIPNTALFAGLEYDDGAAFEIEASQDFGVFDIATTIKRDVTQTHDGLGAEVSLGRTVMLRNAIVEGRFGASYLDQNYSNYLYGVAASEANLLRAAYDVGANWSPYVELSAIIPINDVTSIAAGFRHEQLAQEITDSPLVGTGERTTMGLTLIRSF